MFPRVLKKSLQFILTICGRWLLQNLEKKKINKFKGLQIEMFSLNVITCARLRLKSKCGDWRRQRPKWNVNTEQRDEIGVAVGSESELNSWPDSSVG